METYSMCDDTIFLKSIITMCIATYGMDIYAIEWCWHVPFFSYFQTINLHWIKANFMCNWLGRVKTNVDWCYLLIDSFGFGSYFLCKWEPMVLDFGLFFWGCQCLVSWLQTSSANLWFEGYYIYGFNKFLVWISQLVQGGF